MNDKMSAATNALSRFGIFVATIPYRRIYLCFSVNSYI